MLDTVTYNDKKEQLELKREITIYNHTYSKAKIYVQ
jgi:hypothetical protein